MLTKDNGVPLYIQLQRLLKEDIVTGKYKEGDMIPSETQLSAKYNITRTTVRKAISNLVNEGLLHQVQGKGTFVCLKQVKYNMWNFGGFTDYLKSRNETPYSKVLESKVTEIDGKPYLQLKRARGVKKGRSTILYLTIDTSLIPMTLFPNINSYDFSTASLYDTMRNKYGIYPKRAELGLCPVECDDLMSKIFRLSKQTYLLMAQGKVFDKYNVEIEKVKVIYGPNIEFKIVANMNTYFPE
ncbi:MAG: GntR family transcriptional regulator [Firmicutes bacterium]|nr:GntR family transcriptional regulator [Bacillota bacterium]